jgi:surface polysaccharide O-acyltransferase-like enzyme
VLPDEAERRSASLNISRELSERISILRLPLIVGVVFIHAYDPAIEKGIGLRYTGWVQFVTNYISVGLAAVSVPLLFLFSGYLFFYGFSATPSGFLRKIRKRGKTLLLPLIFWNGWCLAVTALAQAIPATRQYFSGRAAPIAHFSALDYANALLGVTRHPIAYQFWFVRDLLLLVLLSPLIFLVLKRAPVLFLALVTLWWGLDHVWTLPILSREAILFFSIGSMLAMREIDLCRLDKVALVCWLYLPLSIADALTKHNAANGLIHRLSEVCGVACVFCLTKYVRQASFSRDILMALSATSFFVFASHEPLLTIARKLSFRLVSSPGELAIIGLYFADPLIVIGVCIAAYYVCRKIMPQFTGMITGGRAA